MLRRAGTGLALWAAFVVWNAGCRDRAPQSAVPNRSAAVRPTAARSNAVVSTSGDAAGPARSSPSPAHAAPSAPAARPRISPEAFTITADAAGLQLLLSRDSGGGRDETGRTRWAVEPAGLATIGPGGYLRPRAPGIVTVRAELPAGEGSADAPPPPPTRAEARIAIEPRGERSWDFGQDIVPVLSRLGCNAGACHGRQGGQNGFQLSMFGYDPASDYRAVARDAAQRRFSRVAPERSLLLAKALGRVPHGGGPRTLAGSSEFEALLAWARAGAPERSGQTHGALKDVRIEPAGPVWLDGPGARQFRAWAVFEDGQRRDVTRLASYKVNDDSAASVTSGGLVRLHRRAETDLVVRYGPRVLSVRISTPMNPGLAFDFSGLKPVNFIDEELFNRLRSLRVPPSPPAGDAAFLRRATLDLTGEQPRPDEIRGFLAETSRSKRDHLIDELLARKEFVRFWRIKLGDLLQITTARQGPGAARYQAWLDAQLAKNRPWDEVVRELLTAVGDPNDYEKGGPVHYALDGRGPREQAELTARRFLGIRMRCAQCHDHPFDIWSQDAYYGLAAFFAKVDRGGAGGPPGAMMGKTRVTINPEGRVVHPRTGRPVEPTLLNDKVVKVAPRDDPRKALADWMTSPDNPYFARCMANWVWAQLFGKGLVDPPDDMSRANPPVHPELLDALARHFVEHKYDLRDLVRTIVVSRAYGLSSATVPGNAGDIRLFSHHWPRPLTAHQMADALAQATGVPNVYSSGGLRRGRGSSRRAIDVPDPATPSTVLDAFGRCSRAETCAPNPAPTLSLAQALLLIGGDLVDSKVSSLNGYLAGALELEMTPEELVENLYYRTVCRPPTAEETSRWAAELKQAEKPRDAAEDLFWSLLNSREFAFNH